jgi:spore maturation protein CgeB
MASNGFSPPTRVFEAAGAGACLLTDYWEGIEMFLDPGAEVLTARSGAEAASLLGDLTEEAARSIGRAALRRTLAQHTYSHRAIEVERALGMYRRMAAFVRPGAGQ